MSDDSGRCAVCCQGGSVISRRSESRSGRFGSWLKVLIRAVRELVVKVLSGRFGSWFGPFVNVDRYLIYYGTRNMEGEPNSPSSHGT